jgi:hypothetical protein
VNIGQRLWFAGLLLIDWLFGTRLALKEVERRRQRLAEAEAQLEAIRQEAERLTAVLEQVNIAICLFHLRQRQLLIPENWLCFQSADEHEADLLDMFIEHLVKPRLAAIEVRENETGYNYRLIPDWAAIRAALENPDPDLDAWMENMVGYRIGGEQWIDL